MTTPLWFVPAMMRGDRKGAMNLRHSIRWETLAIAVILTITVVLTTVIQFPSSHAEDGGGSGMENMDHGNQSKFPAQLTSFGRVCSGSNDQGS